MVLIEADILETMNTILPQEQNLFPLELKRKLIYEGYYIKEIVDKNKIKIFFDWLKRNNDHFRDLEFEEDGIDKFMEKTRKYLKEL